MAASERSRDSGIPAGCVRADTGAPKALNDKANVCSGLRSDRPPRTVFEPTPLICGEDVRV